MGQALSTLGIRLFYAIGTSTSTDVKDAPKSGWKELPDPYKLPKTSAAAESHDASTLNNKKYKTFAQGLIDVGGSLPFEFNMNDDTYTAWNTMLTEWEAVKDQNYPVWFYTVHPVFSKVGAFAGTPSIMGQPESNTNDVWRVETSVTPTGEPGWVEKPSDLDAAE